MVYLRARMYAPSLNRFLQPDSIVSNPFNPQTWNRYSYVSNRPVNFNDPTGHAQSSEDKMYQTNTGVCKPGDPSCNWVGKKEKEVSHPGVDKYKGTKHCKNDPDCEPTSPVFIGPLDGPFCPNPDDGCQKPGDDPDIYKWWADNGSTVIDVVDFLGTIGLKGYKYVGRGYGFDPTIEAFTTAGLQALADMDNQLTLGQRLGRSFYEGGVAFGVDLASTAIATKAAFKGGVISGVIDGPMSPIADVIGAAATFKGASLVANFALTALVDNTLTPFVYNLGNLYDPYGN